ncbi:MAG: GxxExxY protein [Chloroflexi bacterium]|nr:GxxExxY protein [Chloroflexota bacterium]
MDQSKPTKLVDDALQGLTFQVIDLAMAVHTDLGPGHREETYHNAMTQKFIDANLAAEREPELPIFDESGNKVNFYNPDHRVELKLIVEYKAHSHPLTNDDVAQCFDYFAASDCNVILLFNFGRRRLEWKRLFPPKQILEHRLKRDLNR